MGWKVVAAVATCTPLPEYSEEREIRKTGDVRDDADISGECAAAAIHAYWAGTTRDAKTPFHVAVVFR
jgi:hypothetical protein